MLSNFTSIGIDVSSKKLDICFFGEESKFFVFSNDKMGFDKLTKQIGDMKSLPVIIESTAQYHIPVCLWLNENGYNVKLINPLLASKLFKSSLRKTKTDKIDSQRLAELKDCEYLYNYTDTRNDVLAKRILHTITKLEKSKQAIERSEKNFKLIAKLSDIEIPSELETVSEIIKNIDKKIAELKKLIIKIKQKSKLVNKLSEYRGVGAESAAEIAVILEGKEFKKKSSIVAFAGLDVSIKQSGNYKGKGKLTKRGNSKLRKTLFQVAWGLKQHNEVFREEYQRLRELGKTYKEALNILARKFLHKIYGIMKSINSENLSFSV